MKITLELDRNLTEGELLMYKNGIVKSVEIHELLPELQKIKELEGLVKDLRAELDSAKIAIKELRGED